MWSPELDEDRDGSPPDSLDHELAALRPVVPRNFVLRVEAAIARDAAARRRRRRVLALGSLGAATFALAATFAVMFRAAPPTRPQSGVVIVHSPWTLEGRRSVRVRRTTVTGLDANTIAVLTVTETGTGTETETETETETGTETGTETETATEAETPTDSETDSRKELPMFAAKAAIVLAASAGAVLTVHVVRGRAAVHTDDPNPSLVLGAGDRATLPSGGGGTPTVRRANEATAVARTAPPARAHAAASEPMPDHVANAECEPQAPDEPCDCADGNCEEGQGKTAEQPERVELSIAGAPVMGPKNARVTIVEIVDFQCPFCEKAVATIHDLAALYPDDVRVVIKHMPLPNHKQARGAAIAAMAADRQGKFWEMHEMLFSNQDRLDAASILAHARHVGVDMDRFERDLADPAIAAQVDADFAEANTKGFRGVPAFTINGRVVLGALPLEELRAVVDEELARLK